MAQSKKGIWNVFDRIGGDKVVWMIALTLLLLSIVCLFSSSSRLLRPDQTRVDMVREQFVTAFFGLVGIVAIFLIKDIKVFRFFAKFGFILSIGLLLILDTGGIGPIKALTLNGATRCLSVFGHFQLHVFEVVKVAMVMYLAWAVDALERNAFSIVNHLSEVEHLHWLDTQLAKKIIYIYLPFVLVTVAILPGSNSSALFIGFIMFLTILVGGGKVKDGLLLCLIGVICLGSCIGLYYVSGKKMFTRIGTAMSRLASVDYEKQYHDAKASGNTVKLQDAVDHLRQPFSAKLAIKEGGLLGKGPGQSTQRYVVPDISEDYMFSFILEEYGLIGGILVIALFVSLLARGSLIARNCGNNLFAKATVAGLTLLISGQAFMHMFVNADIGPLTGQTLPLVSHGTSAFLCFCVAFGVILSISRIAQKKVEREIAEMAKTEPIVGNVQLPQEENNDDNVQEN